MSYYRINTVLTRLPTLVRPTSYSYNESIPVQYDLCNCLAKNQLMYTLIHRHTANIPKRAEEKIDSGTILRNGIP